MRFAWFFGLLPLLGCARVTVAPPTTVSAAVTKNQGSGTWEQPIVRCGSRESYSYVAREFQCEDGSNPFHGQLQGAARARQSARKHPNGHLVDLYQVPCTGGPITIYVDMYGCSEQQLTSNTNISPEFQQAEQFFDQGDFPNAVQICRKILQRDEVDRSSVECLALVPAAMALSGGESQAIQIVGAFCSKLPTGEQQKVRVYHIEQIARWLFRGAKERMGKDGFHAVMTHFATACGVNDEQGA